MSGRSVRRPTASDPQLLLTLNRIAGALGGTIEFLRVKSLSDLTTLKPIAIVWLLSAAVGDVMITVILSWSLHQKRSGIRRTDQIVDRIIRGERDSVQREGCELTHSCSDDSERYATWVAQEI